MFNHEEEEPSGEKNMVLIFGQNRVDCSLSLDIYREIENNERYPTRGKRM